MREDDPDGLVQPAAREIKVLGSPLWGQGKITPPLVRSIARNARQCARLDAVESAALWLHGPPGAGKTTLIANWLAAQREDPTWLRLDADNSDPATFFFHLATADARARRADRPRLTPLTPAYQHDLGAFSRNFFRKLFETETQSLVVLDDYQAIATDSPTHDCVARGLNELPSGARLIVISRAPPPKEFARARVNGVLEVVSPDILQLEPAETQDIAQSRGLALASAERDRLVSLCQGWVAGIILLMETHAFGAKIADPSRMTPELLFDYFAVEVLQEFDETERRDLMALSLMPSMTASAARTLSGDPNAPALLERLANRNYFTARDNEPDPNYRFHPLFREFLGERARRAWDAALSRQIRACAARVLESSGQIDAAAERLREAGAWDELAGLVNRWARLLETSGRQKTILAWIGMLPQAYVENDAWMNYWAALATAPFAAAEARPLFRRAFAAFARAGDATQVFLAASGLLDALASDHMASRDELREVVAAVRAFMIDHPDISPPEVEMRFAVSMYGALNQCSPDRAEIAAWRDRMLSAAERVGDPGSRGLARIMIVAQGSVDGDYARVRENVSGLPSPEALDHLPEIQALCYLCHIVAQSHRQAPGSVIETAERALRTIDRTGVRGYAFIFATYAAGDCLRKGDPAQAAAWVARIGENMDRIASQRAPYYYYCACGLDLLNGDHANAVRNGERAIERALASGYRYVEALSRIALAQVYLEIGEWDEFGRQCDAIGRALDASASDSLRFPLALLEAECASLRGQGDLGVAQLREAMAVGERIGARRTYLTPPLTPRLLARALAHHIAPEFVRLLIRNDELAAPRQRVAQWPWPLKVMTLGGFALLKDGAPLALTRKTPKRLFTLMKAIVAFGGADAPQEQIIDAVWPHDDGDAARRSFDTAVYRLRRFVDDNEILVIGKGRVGFNPARCWIDAFAFDEGVSARDAAPSDILNALRLYAADFLPDDKDAVWTAPRRAALRTKFLRTLEKLARDAAANGDWETTLALRRRGIEACPDEEALYQNLMQDLHALGRVDEAIQVFDGLRGALSREGRSPSDLSEAAFRMLKI